MRKLLSASLALALLPSLAAAQSLRNVSGPNAAAALKNQLTVNPDGSVTVLSGPKLGTYQGGRFTSQPDALQIGSGGATGPVDGASVTPNGSAPAGTLSKLLADRVTATSPVFTAPAQAPAITITGPGSTGPVDTMSVTLPGMSTPATLATLLGTTVRFEGMGGRCDGNPASAAGNDAALNRALAAVDLQPYGGEIQFGSGYCLFAQLHPIKITEGKTLAIRGRGRLATKFAYTGATVGTFLAVGSGVQDSQNTILEGFSIYPPTQSAANAAGAVAMAVTNRPAVSLRDVAINGYRTALTLSGSYAPRLTDVVFTNILGRAIQTAADGTANGMALHRVGVYGSGLTDQVPVIDIVGGSNGVTGNGVSVVAADVEGNYQGFKFTNISGASISGSYIERNESGNLLFSGSSAFDIRGNWLGEQSATLTFAGLSRSIIQANTFYNVPIAFDASATDIDFGSYTLLGTAAVTGGPPWNTVALGTGWANVGGSYDPAAFRKHADGSIELKGTILNATTPGSVTAVMTLPPGYQPTKQRQFATLGLQGSGAGYGLSQIAIASNGNVLALPTSAGYASLDGVRFTP